MKIPLCLLTLMTLALSLSGQSSIVGATLLMEARGEGRKGMEAVAEVIYNRAQKRHLTPEQVCLQKWQFSCWNGRSVHEGMMIANNLPKPVRDEAESIASQFANGKRTNHTNWATHYYAPARVDKIPDWAYTTPLTAVIGNHNFHYER